MRAVAGTAAPQKSREAFRIRERMPPVLAGLRAGELVFDRSKERPGKMRLFIESQAKAEIGAEGIGCEPASAVTLAGLRKLLQQGFVKPDETVVLVLTGNLLKDPDFTMEFHRGDLFRGTIHESQSAMLNPFRHPPMVLDATLDAVLKTLDEAEKVGPINSNG